MVDQVGKSGVGSVSLSRVKVGGEASSAKIGSATSAPAPSTVTSMVFDMIHSGPPVDFAKVARLKEAISQGNYPINATKIAERMIALDLPSKSE